MKRTLTLSRDTLAELTPGELAGVTAAAFDLAPPTWPLHYCFNLSMPPRCE